MNEERINFGGRPATLDKARERCTFNLPLHVQGMLHQIADDLDQSKSYTLTQLIEHAARVMEVRAANNRPRYR